MNALTNTTPSEATNLFGKLFNDIDTSLRREGKTSLIQCEQKDDLIRSVVEIAGMLLEKGADINAPISCSSTPLHWAINHHNTEITQFLLAQSGININLQNDPKKTILYRAIGDNVNTKPDFDTEEIKFLLAHPDIDVNLQNRYGYTPLHLAICLYDYKEALEFLLAYSNINVNLQDEYGSTPLHFAVKAKNAEIVRMLSQCENIDLSFNTGCDKDNNEKRYWSCAGKKFNDEENAFMREVFAKEIANSIKSARK